MFFSSTTFSFKLHSEPTHAFLSVILFTKLHDQLKKNPIIYYLLCKFQSIYHCMHCTLHIFNSVEMDIFDIVESLFLYFFAVGCMMMTFHSKRMNERTDG